MTDGTRELSTGVTKKTPQQIILENDFNFPLRDGNFSVRVNPDFSNPKAIDSFKRMVDYAVQAKNANPETDIYLNIGKEKLVLGTDTTPEQVIDAIKKERELSGQTKEQGYHGTRTNNSRHAVSIGLLGHR